jgi:hypothetical protein
MAKCSDRCRVIIGNNQEEGDVPYSLGIGGGDYIRLVTCLDCGQIQGTWPLPIHDIELPKEKRRHGYE